MKNLRKMYKALLVPNVRGIGTKVQGIGQKTAVLSLLVSALLLFNGICVLKLAAANNAQSYLRHERSLDENIVSVGNSVRQEAVPAGGAMFTRWGRTGCPQAGQLVYAGVAGGYHYTHAGSGANYLCLPLDPIYGRIVAAENNHAIIYGAEYEVGEQEGLLSVANLDAPSHQNHNVPCAVCSSVHSSVMMIPGRNVCHNGWTAEYSGFLMSSHHIHYRTQFVCMDEAPEADKSGYTDENGVLFYFVESHCGSLPCPPYGQAKELSCVVCTK